MRWIKAILKFILKLVAIIAVIGVLWFIAAKIRGDDTLNPEIASFYRLNDQSYLKDNGYIALMGVNAPASVADTYNWALQVVRNKTWDSIPDKITPQGDIIKPTSCWITQKWEYDGKTQASCNNRQDITNLINANRLLLTRYHAQFQYNRFVNPEMSTLIGQNMITTQSLFLAYVVLVSETHPDEALQEWINNAAFLKRALADQNNMIMRSILMVMYQMSQKALPSLLNNPAVVAQYKQPLSEILAPFGPKKMNIPLMIRTDGYEIQKSFVARFNNYNQNKFYRFEKDFIALGEVSVSQFPQAETEFKKRHDRTFLLSDWHTPYQGTVTNLVIDGVLMGADLFRAMHDIDARNRLLNLYMQMKVDNVSSAQLPAFLANSPAVLDDPFTNQAFRYDASRNMLYYINSANVKQGVLIE